MPLGQNYRSTQPVLDASNALMAEAPRQYRKHLLAVRGAGPMPRYVTVDDLESQAEYVARRCCSGARPARRCAARRCCSAPPATATCSKSSSRGARFPFVKYGGLKFLEAAHVKDMIAVLRWADNPRNTLAAFRVLQLLPGMGPVNARWTLDALAEAGGVDQGAARHQGAIAMRVAISRAWPS